MAKFEINSYLLLRNILFNILGQVIPLLVALVTIPYIIKGLGTEKFGILSLTWVVFGYFNLFDLGLGRATTKFVAEALGKGENKKIPTIVWTSLIFISILGLIGGFILIAVTPLLVERILNIPSNLIEETKLVFYILSASILITLINATLSGVLEAFQRFDLINILRIASSILTYLIPTVALFFGASLPVVVLLLAIKKFAMLFFYFFYCIRTIPSIKLFFSPDFKVVPSLLNFGGWIALNNAAVAILLYLDRLLVGVFLTASAVTYYTAPYELVNRALIIPSSIMMVLFPAFSSLEAMNREKLKNLFNQALKYLVLIMGLITGFIFVFSREILLFWLGNEFATKSAAVFQIFSVGVFLGSLAWLSGTTLQGIGKPRVVTIIHVLQVPIYILMTWLLIKTMGMEGAAFSWTFRVFLSLFLLLLFCYKERLFKIDLLFQNGSLKFVLGICAISGMTIVAKSFIAFSLINLCLLPLIFIGLLLVTIWKWIFNQEDKVFVITILTRLSILNKKKGG